MSKSEARIIRPNFIKHTALQRYEAAEFGIRSAVEYGFSHWYIDFSLPTESMAMWSSARIDKIQTLIEKTKVLPIMHGNFKSPLASDLTEVRLAAIEYTKKEIDIAAQFNAPLIVHGGGIVEPRLVKYAKKTALDGYVASLDVLLNYAANKGVEIWAENLSNYKRNHPFYYIFTMPEEFDYVLSRFDQLKFFLDIGHANIGNENIYDIISAFCSKMIGVSVSNNNGVRDQHVNLLHGSIDYQRVVNELVSCNWQGFIGVEVRDVSPAQTLQQLVQMYEAAQLNMRVA